MAQLVRFSKCTLFALAIGSCSSAATASDQAFLNFLADQQAQIERGAVQAPLPFQGSSQHDRQAAGEIAAQTRDSTLGAMGADKTPGKYKQFRTLIFITLGMPEKSLRALFRQGAGRSDVGFVLRGMSSTDMYREMKRVRDMMSKEGEANVFVDPLLFQSYRVDRAPFTLHRADNGRWYGLWGEIAVDGARTMIENGQGGRTRAPVGPVYSLKEPDMHEQMRAKFDSADWKKIEQNARQRAGQTEIHINLPAAPADRTRLVDVSSRLMRDVVGPNGQVLATEGTVINPLMYVAMDEPYIVFDPTSRYENEVVAQWRRQHPNAKLVAVHWDTRLGAKYDVPIFVLDPLFKRRMQIEHTPSLVQQDGLRMRVTERRARP